VQRALHTSPQLGVDNQSVGERSGPTSAAGPDQTPGAQR
jgi:hypothetical protein